MTTVTEPTNAITTTGRSEEVQIGGWMCQLRTPKPGLSTCPRPARGPGAKVTPRVGATSEAERLHAGH
jgi:hypothetical protein